MVFPQTPLGVSVFLQIGGVWTDITTDVYLRDGITISRGRADEAARIDPGKCTLTLNNRTGKYSPRNPISPYYGLIGRNTPMYVAVQAGSTYLATTGTTGLAAGASTPDAAALDITGDLDVRLEATLDNWLNPGSIELCGKGVVAGNQRSWLLLMRDRRLHLEWSTAGTSTIETNSTADLPVPLSGHLAVRATLDVNNGAAGKTVVFYTAPTIAGPWTQLGDPVTTAGTTSIFNSSAPVRVGDGWSDVSFPSSSGAVQKFELRNGIAGTVVASPDFTAQTAGATSFADATGKTWTVGTSTTISNSRTRFFGEISSWPPRWDVSGKDVSTPVEAAGILRRLGQGTSPLQSTLRRRVPSFGPLAYWPMEESAGATQAYSPISGVRPLALGPVNWAATDTLASSSPLPTLASTSSALPQMLGRIPPPASPLTRWNVTWLYRLDTANTTLRTFLRILSTGTVAEWFIQSRNDLSRILGRDSDGATVFTQDIGTDTSLFGQWMWVEFNAVQNGGNVDWHIGWITVGGSAAAFDGSFAGTVGRPTGITSPQDGYSPDIDGMTIGHISAWPFTDASAYSGAIDAWAGESAGDRMTRLTSEEGVPFTLFGDSAGQENVGAQRPAVLLELLGDAADADGGILYERRGSIALAYRDRATLYNQPVALALNYATAGHVAPPLEPVDDDQQVRNNILVQRADGTSAPAVQDTGPLSVQAPPNGVGNYDDSVTLNLATDDQPEQHANWRLHLGTWDEARYPTLHVDLSAAPSLIDTAVQLDSGDRIQISNPPAWLPPGIIDLLMQGYAETIGVYDWDLTFNCTPAGPWNIWIVEDPLYGRADTSGAALTAAVTSTATTLSVSTATGPIWTADLTDLPMDVQVGGEVMSVGGITGDRGDRFERSVASGWGTATSGQAWSTSGGSASDFSVQGG